MKRNGGTPVVVVCVLNPRQKAEDVCHIEQEVALLQASVTVEVTVECEEKSET